MHQYFHTGEGQTDLQKMRDEATARAFSTGLFTFNEPQSSIIHHHPYLEDCEGKPHEYYRRTVGKVDNEGEMDKHG